MNIKNRIVSFACTLLAGASLLQAQQEEHPNSGVGSDSQVTLTDSTPAPTDAINNGPSTAIDQTALRQRVAQTTNGIFLPVLISGSPGSTERWARMIALWESMRAP